MKIEPIKPNLISGNVSVSLSAGEQQKGLQYSPTVNRTGKKIKNVSLRHYHLPTLSSGVNGVEHVDARKAIFARHCQKLEKSSHLSARPETSSITINLSMDIFSPSTLSDSAIFSGMKKSMR